MSSTLQDFSDIAEQAEGTGNSQNKSVTKDSCIYRAKCIDNKDPLKTGRIKIVIPEVNYTKYKEGEGVWAYPCTPFAGCNLEESDVSDFGCLMIPPINSYVFIFFEGGDINRPVYFGGLITEGAIPTENQAGEKWYAKHTLIKTPKKRLIMVSDDDSSDSCIIIRGMERS